MQAGYEEIVKKLKAKQSYSQYLVCEESLKNSDLPQLKVAILRNYTVEMMVPVIIGEAALTGYNAEIYVGEYDNVFQEVLEPAGDLYQFKPDFLILSLWLENLSPKLTNEFAQLSHTEIEEELQRVLMTVKNYVELIKRYSKAIVLLDNFVLPSTPELGIYDLQSTMSQTEVILSLNHEICTYIKKIQNVYLVDVASLVYKVGYNNAIDSKMWAISKNPFGKDMMVNLCKEYFKFIKTMRGKVKKCLVLDCDNTLWGGVVGETGTHGIKLNDDYPGRCYKDLQKEILNLYSRGVIIALCSKNNRNDVLDVLKNNKEMLIREKHISAMQINWDNKAINIVRLADTLNIGLDSMVFIDDSDFECNLVKEKLPEVEVMQLLGEVSQYKQTLRDSGIFNTLQLTEDDKSKTEMYRAEAERIQLRESFLSVDAYLQDLNMQAFVNINDISEISRVSQLTQKTNQFNLTTIRYTEEDIQQFVLHEGYDVITIRLEDKVASLGIIGVAIIKYREELAEIDEFLLSCRAIGRTVEHVMMQIVVDRAKHKGIQKIQGKYIVTAKNAQVENFYQQFGFKKECELNKNEATWRGEISEVVVNTKNLIQIILE